MEREDVMRRIRLEIDQPGHKDGLKKNKAAQLLGVSRQRVTQLYAAWNKRRVPKMETPAPLPEPPAAPPPPTPKDINEVLAPVGGGPVPELPKNEPRQDTPAKDETALPPSAPPPAPTQGEPVDPEDAAAGRDLVRWFVRGFKEGLARWVFKIKRDDPRMVEIREENEFLRIAIKRNSEKAAPLGKLTKGPVGLGIGAAIESIKMAFIIDDDGDVPVTSHREVKKDLPRTDDPPSQDAPRKVMTMDEKIAAANKAKL